MRASALPCIALLLATCATAQPDSWPQWGGPDRNFSVKSAPLADTWPTAGPPRLWHRPLGDGYAGLVSDGQLVFTMYRPTLNAPEEVVVALDAATGKLAWEQRFASKLKEPVSEHGHGPFATPILAGEHLYAVGTQAVVRCFDKATGKLQWSRDLIREFNAPQDKVWGYTNSPVVHNDLLILPLGYQRGDSGAANDGPPMPGAGGRGNLSLLALHRKDGKEAWQGDDYFVSQSSPMLIRFADEEYLVLLGQNSVVGIDPATGKEQWRALENLGAYSITPNWDGRDLLWFAAQGGPGHGVRLVREDGKTVAKSAWTNPKMSSSFYMGAQDGDQIYMPGGARFYAYDRGTGERLWIERGFESASCILANDKLFILDQNGQLTLATPSREKLTIHAQAQVADRYALTSPILVDRKLIIRDRKNIMAFDVGK